MTRNYFQILLWLTIFTFQANAQSNHVPRLAWVKKNSRITHDANGHLSGFYTLRTSPLTSVPKGFTLSDYRSFLRYDSLTKTPFIRYRPDFPEINYFSEADNPWLCYHKFGNQRKQHFTVSDFKNGCHTLFMHHDTTELTFKNEYIEPQSIIYLDNTLPYTLVSEQYVTNREYAEFVSHVIDSIKREYIILRLFYNQMTGKKKYDFSFEYKRFIAEHGGRNSTLFSPANENYRSILSELYYPEHERYYFKKCVDVRKTEYAFQYIDLNGGFYGTGNFCNERVFTPGQSSEYLLKNKNCYNHLQKHYVTFSEKEYLRQGYMTGLKDATDSVKNYNLIPYQLCVHPDSLLWLNRCTNTDKCYYTWVTENYGTLQDFRDYPVANVNYWQAKAFLEWKTKNHNRVLIKNKSPYLVQYTFPLPEEISDVYKPEITTPPVNFDDYIITNAEYFEFVNYVADSIATCLQFEYDRNENPEKDSPYKIKTYDDHGDVNDPSLWRNNTSYYHEILKKDLKKENELFLLSIEPFIISKTEAKNETRIDPRKLFFKYYWINYDSAAVPLNKDLDLSGYNRLGNTKGRIRSHMDRSAYIIRETINVFPLYNWRMRNAIDAYNPETDYTNTRTSPWSPPVDSLTGNIIIYDYDFLSEPNKQIQDITFDQAKAFYFWQNKVPYMPTPDQWNEIQKGNNPFQQKKIPLTGNYFRYVIRIYPADKKM